MSRLFLYFVSACLYSILAQAAPAPLPSGNNGIAASYPGDANIQSHPDVLFFDGFDSYTSNSQLTGSGNWHNFYQNGNIAFDLAVLYSGTKALRFTMPQSASEVSNAVVKTISPSQDKLHVRACTRYQPNYSGVNSAHNGIRITANYTGPGRRPNGSDFFLVNVENSRYQGEGEPGYTHVYVYHPEQNDVYGEHWYPSGLTSNGDGPNGGFGPDFVSRQNVIPARGAWLCHELMVQANTPGARDGRIAIWENGTLLADFQSIRFRDIGTVKINEIQLENGGQGSTQSNQKWYDNVVVAKSYIGPMSSGGPTSPAAPTNLRIAP
ncbi:MAG: hypothetical protein ACREYC_15320 [Gammaproteobacteria bacterium]